MTLDRVLIGNGLVVRTDAPSEAQLYQQRLARYRASALRGIARAWRDAPSSIAELPKLHVVADLGPACFIANKPRSTKPRAVAPREPLQTLSKNGKRLPLRAIPWRDLNREVWSKGTTLFADKYESNPPRELTLHEKMIDPFSMTAEEIWESRDYEPLSESRRAWLELGVNMSHIHGTGGGMLSLEGFAEGSIGATLSAKGIEGIEVDPTDDIVDPVETEFADERSSFGRGTPYTTLDPTTAKQIAFEQEQHSHSEVTRVRLAQGENGLKIETDRYLLPDDLMRLARSVKRTLATAFGHCESLDDLHARVAALKDEASAATIDFTSADANEERERFLAPADPEWHSSYEFPVAVAAILSETECDRIAHGLFCETATCWCNRRGCTITECHHHERITRIAHRRPNGLKNKDELWHRRLFDVTAYELGTDGLVDPLVTM